ncbi:alpha/beta fold hydrolase [Rufibacter sediminis]|uniref:Alpha/beta hydrolase n=1 Tax=Rufibacter sediminis TaxID=2762756 RepID=A0ABR6VQZ1_9BACT|nr:alpha/beta hydrolase [Rufibacter sediminis]MBC3539332.1 alpha/beta hydrolase [Rufibacter sediminis]
MKYILAFVLILSSLSSMAQVKKYVNSLFFLPNIPTEKYAGSNYRFKIDIKSQPEDTLSKVTIYALQVGKGDYDFLEYNHPTSLPQDTLWNTYTIHGKLSEQTRKIWFYVNQVGNGKFFIDNLTLQISDKGTWRTIDIPDGDFEKVDPANPLKKFEKSLKIPAGTRLSIEQVSNPTPSKALLVTASGGKLHWITQYGSNPPKGNYCSIKGTPVYYETYGEGEPLLLLHGNGQSIGAFSRQIPELAKKYKVICVDTRAQGKSIDSSSAPLSYNLFADDMKTLLDSLNLRKVHVVGWSDGGNTALTMAIKYPAYVDKIAVMGANLNPTSAAVLESMLKQTSKDLARLKKQDDSKSRQSSRLLTLLLTEPNIPAQDLNNIQARTLVMAGENDVIKEQHTKLIAANIKGSKLIIFKGQTHNLPKENPALFNEAVLQFLAGQ